MNKIIILIISSILTLSIANAAKYEVDTSHSQVEFKIKHLSVSNVKGSFNSFSGNLEVENNKLIALQGEVEIDSINTNNETRDAHIKDDEYFNVKSYPKATLKLVKANADSGVFELTIKGIKKQVSLDIEVFGTSKNQAGEEIVGLSISGKINRKDFDIAKSTPGVAIGDEIALSIDIEGTAK